MDYIVVYQKSNGKIIYRPVKYIVDLTIGKETSMGWKVIDIQYYINNKYCSYEEYKKILEMNIEKVKKEVSKHQKKQKIVEFFTKNRNIGGKK